MKKIFVLFILCVGLSSTAHAFNGLHVYVRTGLPIDIRTVGEAAEYLVEAAGYRVITTFPAPEESLEVSQGSLSALSLVNKVITIEEALLLVIGEENRLVVDHEHKLISFELNK